MGINQGLQPIASYNYGAKQPDRIKQVVKLALYIRRSSGLLDQSSEFYFQVR